MTLNRFSLAGMRQLAVMSALLGSMLLTPAVAVELVGKPVPIDSSSASITSLSSDVVESPDIAATQLNTDSQNSTDSSSVKNKHNERSSGVDLKKQFYSEALIPVVAIFLGIGGPIVLIIALVAMHYRNKDRREKNNNANIERLLAAGRDIPIELLRGDEPYISDDSPLIRDDINLRKGIKNVCLGLGIFVCFTIMFGIEPGAIGFIVLSIGISQLWLWKLSGNKKDNSQNQG